MPALPGPFGTPANRAGVTTPGARVNTVDALRRGRCRQPSLSLAYANVTANSPRAPYEPERIGPIFVFLGLGAFAYLVADLVLPYARPVVWAVILAVVFYPFYRMLSGLMPRYPSVAAGLMTAAVYAGVVVPALVLSSVIARETLAGYQQFSAFVGSGGLGRINEWADHWAIAPLWEWVRERMTEGEVNPSKVMLSGLRWASEVVAARAAAIARNVFAFFVGIAIMLFTLFFAFRDGEQMVSRFRDALPLPEGDRRRLIDRVQQTLLAVVQGITVTAAVQGALLGLGLWALGVPFAAVLATAAFFFAFLPVGGASIVWVPTVIGVFVAGDYVRGVILAVYCFAVVSSVDNFLRPMLIGSQARLSTPILFFGILGGIQAYGIVGLFVGPAILSVFSVLLGIYHDRYLAAPQRGAPPEPTAAPD